MKYEVTLTIIVDEDANFLPVDGDYRSSVEELIENLFFDIDDVDIIDMEIDDA